MHRERLEAMVPIVTSAVALIESRRSFFKYGERNAYYSFRACIYSTLLHCDTLQYGQRFWSWRFAGLSVFLIGSPTEVGDCVDRSAAHCNGEDNSRQL